MSELDTTEPHAPARNENRAFLDVLKHERLTCVTCGRAPSCVCIRENGQAVCSTCWEKAKNQ